MTAFTALWITETPDGRYQRSLVERQVSDLPAGDVLIQVAYSSLNYKDALSASGNRGVTRQYPHTPGVDAAGYVVASTDPAFRVGEAVLVTGYDLGMNTAGGFGGYIRVPAAWVLPLPADLTLRDSMIYGTAGFTAALSVYQLQQAGLRPDQGEVLVTGASGGVGCVAVALLSKLGYTVVAGSGKASAQAFLRSLGASEILSRAQLQDETDRALLKSRWAGVVDTVGGDILATALKSTRYGGCVSCCGLVAGAALPTTVFPFILRGVNLLGIDSVACPLPLRRLLWQHLATDWRIETLAQLVTETDLSGLKDHYLDAILRGAVQGRVLVKHAKKNQADT